MTVQTWWIFFCAATLISSTPGPNMLHVMTRAMRFGVARSIFAMAGCLSGVLTLFGLSAAGMGTLLSAMPELFTVVKVAGAAYLIYLGIKAWRSDVAAPAPLEGEIGGPVLSAGALFRGGLTVGISNPKALIFAAAFFPQFVNPLVPKGPQLALLVATFAAVDSLFYFIYALGGRSIAGRLRRASRRRALDRITGGLFMGFGASLLAWRA
jgi:threonine/homoserine/homoserine lactone efflux protein